MPKYSEDTKAAALAALLTGQAVNKVAEEYPGIPLNTLKSWRKRMRDGEVAALAPRKKTIGDKVIENLHASQDTRNALLKAVADPKWIQRQSAEGIAVLYGVMADKELRILEMLDIQEED